MYTGIKNNNTTTPPTVTITGGGGTGHRCAFCGVRMLTSDGHTAVDAAHIIPWNISHDDDPHNGMALCGLCHWTFDQGLLGVSARYLVLLSGELRITQNVPGHLLTLEKRPIIGPAEQDLWPHVEGLEWHRENVCFLTSKTSPF